MNRWSGHVELLMESTALASIQSVFLLSSQPAVAVDLCFRQKLVYFKEPSLNEMVNWVLLEQGLLLLVVVKVLFSSEYN